jgi:IS5 family transposase
VAEHLQQSGVKNQVHEKGQVNHPLTDDQKERNRRKSKVRARVEHPFAFMECSLGGIYHRSIGKIRNAYQIGMMNLSYNLCRFVQLSRAGA